MIFKYTIELCKLYHNFRTFHHSPPPPQKNLVPNLPPTLRAWATTIISLDLPILDTA